MKIHELLTRFASQLTIPRVSLASLKAYAQTKGILPLAAPAIIVGGTNGKGSCVALLSAIYRHAHYRVGTFTSPHLLTFNERIVVDGQPITDAECEQHLHALAAHTLTDYSFFDITTLLALRHFNQAEVDIMILEVGIGGRLDATNIVDAELAIITSIDLDHTELLGGTRAAIGLEKAGIFRADQVAIIGDMNVPAAVSKFAEELGVALFVNGRDFFIHRHHHTWDFITSQAMLSDLPMPTVFLPNAASSLMAVEQLQTRFPVPRAALEQALVTTRVPGRFQRLAEHPLVIVDVAHNPAACQRLLEQLNTLPKTGKLRAVIGMMKDKAIAESIAGLADVIEAWFVATLPSARSATQAEWQAIFSSYPNKEVYFFDEVTTAFMAAKQACMPEDRVVVFGSFLTVAAVMSLYTANS